jgi:diadenosine tetraphosphate (Ap4A) HIT family hydrolase
MYHLRKKRMTYVKNRKHDEKQTDCPLCADKTDQRLVEQTDNFRIISNRTPYDFFEGRKVSEHYMIVPKRHIETLDDFNETERLEHAKIASRYEKKGFDIYSRGVGSIGRSIKHQHTHLIKNSNKLTKLYIFIEKPYFLFHR